MSAKQSKPTDNAANFGLSRRTFMATAGAAATWSILEPQHAGAFAANAKVNIGLIGCGGRGAWIADLFQEHGGYNLVAVADYFQDRVDNVGTKLGVPEANRFVRKPYRVF